MRQIETRLKINGHTNIQDWLTEVASQEDIDQIKNHGAKTFFLVGYHENINFLYNRYFQDILYILKDKIEEDVSISLTEDTNIEDIIVKCDGDVEEFQKQMLYMAIEYVVWEI